MIDYKKFIEKESKSDLAPWMEILPQQIQSGLCTQRHGDLVAWLQALASLPTLELPITTTFNNKVSATTAQPLDETAFNAIKEALEQLIPWRKGPYNLFDINIDTEWRSDWKWDRLIEHIAPLKNKRVLDVGCGNGYHCWRMYGQGARQVIGIDPSPRFIVQFYMLKHFFGKQLPVDIFPVAMEDMPDSIPVFDTTFSMGVLYHRRSPFDHLRELKNTLRPKGQLILETLVIEGHKGEVLVPEGRYAKMRNVWFLPSVPTLLSWLKKCGFINPRCVDLNQTSIKEQRATNWMQFQSLPDFLDPNDSHKTAEGHPAPLRAIIVADNP